MNTEQARKAYDEAVAAKPKPQLGSAGNPLRFPEGDYLLEVWAEIVENQAFIVMRSTLIKQVRVRETRKEGVVQEIRIPKGHLRFPLENIESLLVSGQPSGRLRELIGCVCKNPERFTSTIVHIIGRADPKSDLQGRSVLEAADAAVQTVVASMNPPKPPEAPQMIKFAKKPEVYLGGKDSGDRRK